MKYLIIDEETEGESIDKIKLICNIFIFLIYNIFVFL